MASEAISEHQILKKFSGGACPQTPLACVCLRMHHRRCIDNTPVLYYLWSVPPQSQVPSAASAVYNRNMFFHIPKVFFLIYAPCELYSEWPLNPWYFQCSEIASKNVVYKSLFKISNSVWFYSSCNVEYGKC